MRLIDARVPPVEAKRRTQLSVGQYLVLAAINRVIDTRSKRAFYEYWYQDSVLARLCPAKEGELTSQRFWDHMNQVQPEHLESVQKDLVARLGELFPLGEDTILYHATKAGYGQDLGRRPAAPARTVDPGLRQGQRQQGELGASGGRESSLCGRHSGPHQKPPRERLQQGIGSSPDRGVDRARPPARVLQETLVIYTNGASERLLSDRDSLQEQLFQALDLGLIAEQLG
ncbi:MAG: hypothetical protein EHM23_34000, partial [Acidobacteria bacterium]